jgi:hypothetical protein
MKKPILYIITILALWGCNSTDDEEETLISPPQVIIISPTHNAEIELGNLITISVTANDAQGINFVRFFIDDVEVDYQENAPFSYIWDTSEETIGQHEIKVETMNIKNKSAYTEINITLIEPRFTLNFSGFLKNRYTNEGLGQYELFLGPTSIITDQSGNFTLNNYKTADKTAAIKFSGNEIFIPTLYGFDITGSADIELPLYLYPIPETVNPQASNFIKGVSLFDAGPWMGEDLYPDAFESTFTRLQGMNANTVTVFDPVFVTVVGTDSVKMSTSSNTSYSWNMLSDEQYTTLSQNASGKGLDMMYWFGVWPQDEEQLSGQSFNQIVFSGTVLSDKFWSDWFGEYTRILKDYAEVAEMNGIPYISLGHGLNYATSPHQFSSESLYHTHWTNLINEIRSVYNGEILYFTTARPFTALNYSGGTEIAYYEDSEFTSTFINLFDAFGVIVSNVTQIVNPTVAEVKVDVESILTRYQTFGKPIVLWVWAPSVDGAANRYGHLEPVLAVSNDADKFAEDFYEQADIYQGILEAVNASTATINIKGIISHGFMYSDQFLRYEPRDMETAFNKAASVRNKPAEMILKYWYGVW